MEVNNMSDLKQLSQSTIQLQHDVRLATKKIDVVGVLQTKTNNTLTKLESTVNESTNKVDAIDIQQINIEKNKLIEKVSDVANQQKELIDGLNIMIDRTDEIGQALTTAKVSVLDELYKQQQTNSTQLNNVSQRLTEAQNNVAKHMSKTTLDNIENAVQLMGQETTTMSKTSENANNRVMHTLDDVQYKLNDLAQKGSHIEELNDTFTKLMKDMKTLLTSVDDKVCQISPMYTGPSEKDIEASFRELANDDMTHLLEELRAGYTGSYKFDLGQETNDIDSIENLNNVSNSTSNETVRVQAHTIETISKPVTQQPVDNEPVIEQYISNEPVVDESINEPSVTLQSVDELQIQEPIEIILPPDIENNQKHVKVDFEYSQYVKPEKQEPELPKPKKKGFFARLFGGE